MKKIDIFSIGIVVNGIFLLYIHRKALENDSFAVLEIDTHKMSVRFNVKERLSFDDPIKYPYQYDKKRAAAIHCIMLHFQSNVGIDNFFVKMIFVLK